jgi:hypothetical protein
MVLALFFASSPFAAIDERLLGTWEQVDDALTPAERITATFKTDGTFVMKESNWNVDAAWEADGKILRLFGIEFLSRKDAEFFLEYRIEDLNLFLRVIDEDSKSDDENKEIILTKSMK